MITHIDGSECYNHIMLHTHQTQVLPRSCLNGGLPEKIIKYHKCRHSEHLFSDGALWKLRGGKSTVSLTEWSLWGWWKYCWLTEWPLPESLFSWFLLCFIAAQLLNKNINCTVFIIIIMITIVMIVSNIIIFSALVPHFHFHPPMSCFCLNHLLLWRLSRSWWLSLLAISRIICFHCLQDFSLNTACLSSQFYQRNIHFLLNAILCSPEMGD